MVHGRVLGMRVLNEIGTSMGQTMGGYHAVDCRYSVLTTRDVTTDLYNIHWDRILEMCDNYRMRKYHSVFF